MKRTGKLLPMLCILWYIVCVTGFDIHFCGDNGHVYIEPLFAGISCGTIHPDAPCACDGRDCCSDDEECCQDLIALLDVPGDGTDCAVASLTPSLTLSAIITTESFRIVTAVAPARTVSGYSPPPGHILSLFSVFRV